MAFFNQFPNRTYDLKRDGSLVNIQDLFRNVDVNEQLIDKVSAYQFYKIKDGERPDQASFRLYQNAGYYWTFFIVNDDLKNGYKNWPKSYQQLQDFVKQEYTDYAILELKPDDFSKVAAISNFTSLSLGFQYNSPLGQNESPANVLGTIHKIDLDTHQLWIKNPSTRLINSLNGKTNHETYKIFDTSDGDNFSPAFQPQDGWGYGDNATAYYKDANGKRIGIYDSPKPSRVTYREFEDEENESLRSIRIVKPDQIVQFAELYKNLINE